MDEKEIERRLNLARIDNRDTRPANEGSPNCLGLLLYMMGVIERYKFVKIRSPLIKEHLIATTVMILTSVNLREIPDLNQVDEKVVGIGFWRNVSPKHYLHMVYVCRLWEKPVLFERRISYPLKKVSLQSLVHRYYRQEEKGTVELRFLYRRTQ